MIKCSIDPILIITYLNLLLVLTLQYIAKWQQQQEQGEHEIYLNITAKKRRF